MLPHHKGGGITIFPSFLSTLTGTNSLLYFLKYFVNRDPGRGMYVSLTVMPVMGKGFYFSPVRGIIPSSEQIAL
ncbi:MAG: hypothetical protein DRI61_09170 [Chloroflexi bacterium]|nr:MAG: hypothetical protein DRI61_09170 [Chloroflexota bacterium]